MKFIKNLGNDILTTLQLVVTLGVFVPLCLLFSLLAMAFSLVVSGLCYLGLVALRRLKPSSKTT